MKTNPIQSIRNIADNYNSIAKHFSNTRNRSWPEFNFFKKYIKDNQNILDWGCGNGRLLDFLKDFNIKYYGIDVSDKLITVASNIYRDLIEQKKALFFSTYDKEKRFEDNFFDNVFMIASFNHLPDEKSRLQVLKNTYNALKTGGRLMMTVWNLESEWFKKKKEFEIVGDNDYLVNWKDAGKKTKTKLYYHNFSKSELSSLLTKTGFKVEKCEYFNDDFVSDKAEARNLIALACK